MPAALAGVRVVEIASGGGLPLAAMLLADLGAEVIRVERAGSRRRGSGSDAVLRNRQSITVDLRQPAGVEAVRRLASASAALVEGLRPGIAEAIGIGPDVCCANNPALVYGRLSGWGSSGPAAGRPGHDLNFLAAAGVLDAAGIAASAADRAATTVADRGAPALLFAFGMVCALYEAARSGRGQVVDCASTDTYRLLAAKFGPTGDPATEPPTHVGAPYYGTYATAGNGHVAVAAVEPARWRDLLDALGLDVDALPGPHDAAGWAAMRSLVADAFAGHNLAHWVTVFEHRDAGVTPVRAGGAADPRPAPLLSRTPGAVVRPAPVPGADFRSVLSITGYSTDAVDELVRTGAVVPPA